MREWLHCVFSWPRHDSGDLQKAADGALRPVTIRMLWRAEEVDVGKHTVDGVKLGKVRVRFNLESSLTLVWRLRL